MSHALYAHTTEQKSPVLIGTYPTRRQVTAALTDLNYELRNGNAAPEVQRYSVTFGTDEQEVEGE